MMVVVLMVRDAGQGVKVKLAAPASQLNACQLVHLENSTFNFK